MPMGRRRRVTDRRRSRVFASSGAARPRDHWGRPQLVVRGGSFREDPALVALTVGSPDEGVGFWRIGEGEGGGVPFEGFLREAGGHAAEEHGLGHGASVGKGGVGIFAVSEDGF